MEFSQAVMDFSRLDLRGADGLCWEMRPVGEVFFSQYRVGFWALGPCMLRVWRIQQMFCLELG